MNSFEIKILNKFFSYRNDLIDRLEEGKLSKRDFLLENYMLISKLSMKPFSILNSPEKCMYNYQYYNVLAKYTRIYGIKDNMDRKSLKDVKERISNYYSEKDKIILNLLDDFPNLDINSYYIETNSHSLNTFLVEIVIKDYYRYVLHTINLKVVDKLIKKGILDDGIKKSVIDSYVNSGY